MASPTESKVDENEVTSEPRHRRNRDGRGQGGDDQELDVGYPLVRQSSIYSLTLDEIQNTVCEPGKTFGSMNMDEFLSNIWSVEEGFAAVNNNVSADSAAAAAPANAGAPNGTTGCGGGGGGGGGGGSGSGSDSAASGDPPLHRHGSLAIPPPLCRKTVDEVWAEMYGEQGVHRDVGGRPHRRGGNAGNADRQQTFGEMTLEDFLIKAGVVREGFGPALPHPPVSVAAESMQQSYGMPTSYQMGTGAEEPGFGHVVGPTVYEYPPPPHHRRQRRPAVSEGHGNGYGMQLVRLGSPVSPVSSEGIGGGHMDSSGYHGNGGGAGIVMNGALRMNGRKRGADGGVEKVVERRQRRMIKNRESAARSRARKQAYTVELEAELNLLKEENARLKDEERRAQARRKQTILECMAEHSRANMEKAERTLRRCNSGPL